jgi:hypothetical protein
VDRGYDPKLGLSVNILMEYQGDQTMLKNDSGTGFVSDYQGSTHGSVHGANKRRYLKVCKVLKPER